MIGGVLTFFAFLLIPLFAVQGYLLRVIRTSIDGESRPPEFDDWGALVVKGLKAWLIGVVYMLVPAIVAFVTIGSAIAAMVTGSQAGAAAGLAGLFGGLALTVVLSLTFGYLAVAAIVLFAREGEFGAAFDVEQLRDLAFNTDYAVAWVVSVVVFLVAGVVASVPLVGFVLGPFASFYAVMVAGRLWAGGYVDAMGVDGGASPGVDERTAI